MTARPRSLVSRGQAAGGWVPPVGSLWRVGQEAPVARGSRRVCARCAFVLASRACACSVTTFQQERTEGVAEPEDRPFAAEDATFCEGVGPSSGPGGARAGAESPTFKTPRHLLRKQQQTIQHRQHQPSAPARVQPHRGAHDRPAPDASKQYSLDGIRDRNRFAKLSREGGADD